MTTDLRIVKQPEAPSEDVKWLAMAIRRGMLVIIREIERRYGMESPPCPHCKSGDSGKRYA